MVELLRHPVERAVAGMTLGMIRWQVSAVSVVLMPQMWRSCSPVTPGSASRCARTAAASTPSGTASKARPIALFNRPQVPMTMTAETTRLTTGSSHNQPVHQIAMPAATTRR